MLVAMLVAMQDEVLVAMRDEMLVVMQDEMLAVMQDEAEAGATAQIMEKPMNVVMSASPPTRTIELEEQFIKFE
jgi:hypothetical protein